MKHRSALLLLALATSALAPCLVLGDDRGNAASGPPVRAIPGVTAADPFPNACVDCHVDYPERKMDVRLSTLMKSWRERVQPGLLAKARAAAPAGAQLEGRHPDVGPALTSIPGDCVTCHAKDSSGAPAFASLMHSVHLTGGAENHFIKMFQGECTHCHKIDARTGTAKVPSASEK